MAFTFLQGYWVSVTHLQKDPQPDVMTCIALLGWITVPEATQYYKKIKRELAETLKADEEKERWKTHELYHTKPKPQLEAL